jgi:hypothetical protein
VLEQGPDRQRAPDGCSGGLSSIGGASEFDALILRPPAAAGKPRHRIEHRSSRLATGLHEVGLIIGAARSGGSLPIERQNPSRDSLFSHNADRTIPGIAWLAWRRNSYDLALSTMEILAIENVRQRLKEDGKSAPVFTPSTLGEYCELTDLIRQCWTTKSNERVGYVGEILPWFRGVEKASHTLTPKLARIWSEYSGLYRSIFDLEDYYFDRFTRFGRPFLNGTMPQDEIE